MHRWLIWFPASVILCGCQFAQQPMSDDCLPPNPCYESGSEERLPVGAAPGPVVTLADLRPLWPGCPSTLQVMLRPHPILYHAARPADQPETAADPSDWFCAPPDPPLLRATRPRSGPGVTAG